MRAQQTRDRRDQRNNRDQIRNRRLIVVGATLVVLVLAVVLVVKACAGGSASGGSLTRDDSGRQVAVVPGETAAAGEVAITVTVLGAVGVPALPDEVVDGSEPAAIRSGQSFYQAFVRVKNGEPAPVRIDPLEFWLADGDRLVAADATRSGPTPRSLLPGASLNAIITFRARGGLEPELVYRPGWFDGSVVVRGELLPAGMSPPTAESAVGR